MTTLADQPLVVLVTGASAGRGADTGRVLDRFYAKFSIGLLVLGDSYNHTRHRGVDGEALDWALTHSVPHVVELADNELPRAERFKPRNIRMAEHLPMGLGWALALPGQYSRGTWQTLSFAKQRNARWFVSMHDGSERWGRG